MLALRGESGDGILGRNSRWWYVCGVCCAQWKGEASIALAMVRIEICALDVYSFEIEDGTLMDFGEGLLATL